MASKERLYSTSVKSERVEVSTSKTAVLMEGWRRERSARMAAQLAVNAEIKQRWLKSESIEAPPDRVATGPATFSRQPQRRGAPFKALLTALEIPVNQALAYVISVLGIQRLAGKHADTSRV